MTTFTPNYMIRVDHMIYEGWRNGRPFTLTEAWREVDGVRNAAILAPSGRVVLENAGSSHVRRWDLPNRAAEARRSRRLRALAHAIDACPYCGNECYQDAPNSGWTHGWRRGEGCTVEYFRSDASAYPQQHAFEVIAEGMVTA